MDKSRYVLGGAVWINLVNTINKRLIDLLDDESAAIEWLKQNELLRDSDFMNLKNDNFLHHLIDKLCQLRNLCKMILSNLEQEGKLSADATAQLQQVLKQVKVNLALITSEEKLHLVCQGTTLTDHVHYEIVYSIIHTLGSITMDRIRKCEHENCILYFIDTSKSGKRRWCSMETCGNRQKAAEFYARKKKK